jgi:hypothetical protein
MCRVGGLQVAVRAVQTHPAQVLQRSRAQVSAERVLHGSRRHIDGSGNIFQADVGVRVFLYERHGISQNGRHIPHVIVTSHCSRTPLIRMVKLNVAFVYPANMARKQAQQRLAD